MIERSANDTVFAQWACGLFALLRGTDPAAAIAAAVQAEEQQPCSTSLISDWRWPKACVIRCRVYTLILINCTETLVQAANLAAGYATRVRGRTGTNVRNDQLWSGAEYYFSQLGDQASIQNDVKIIGHSQGGAIAPWLARKMKEEISRLRIGVLSYGAPKFGGTSYVLADNNRFAITRYMNVGDPIPSFPYVSETNLAMTLLAPEAVANSSSFSQHWGGRRLDADGSLRSYSSEPSDSLVPNLPEFSAWLINTELGTDTPHSIDVYRSRLAMYNAANPPGAGVTIPSVRPDPPLRVPVAEANRAANAVATSIAVQGTTQQRARLEQPSQMRFYVVRKGRVWQVWLGNAMVAIGPKKKRARGMARFGNALLARMQRSAFVDPVAMTAQIGNVILQMSDPASGFRPPLATEMPPIPPFRLRGR